MYYKKSISYNDIRGYKYTIEDFIDAITKIIQFIKDIKFNKLNGKLSTNYDISIKKKKCIYTII